MKRLTLFIVLISIAVLSCTPTLIRNSNYEYEQDMPKILKNRCDSTGIFIRDSWHYNVKTKLYEIKSRKILKSSWWVDMLPYCKSAFILGLEKKNVLKVFGKPHKDKDMKWEYYLTIECKKGYNECRGCKSLSIFFNKEGKVINIGIYQAECIE